MLVVIRSAHQHTPRPGIGWRRDQGGLWDVGPHMVSLLWASLGPVTSVTADRGPADVTHLILHHQGGEGTGGYRRAECGQNRNRRECEHAEAHNRSCVRDQQRGKGARKIRRDGLVRLPIEKERVVGAYRNNQQHADDVQDGQLVPAQDESGAGRPQRPQPERERRTEHECQLERCGLEREQRGQSAGIGDDRG